MRRVAILCMGTGGDELPGVPADIGTMADHLRSAEGGAWEPSEIEVLQGPDLDEFQLVTRVLAEAADYTFFYFAGHGDWDPRTGRTNLQLNDEHEIALERVPVLSARALLIADSCREPPLLTEEVGRGRAAKLAKAEDPVHKIRCRALFDWALAGSGIGKNFVYGCAPFHQADEDFTGGVFTQTWLEGVRDWCSMPATTSDQILRVKAAFEVTANSMAGFTAQQPQLRLGRGSRPSFPVAVIPRRRR